MTGVCRSAAVAVALAAVPVAATAVEWSAPRPVFRSTGHVRDPVVVDDSSGATHLFFDETTGEPGVRRLVYMRRDQAGWSEPVYVLDPVVRVEFPAAAIDSRGWLHVVYAGPQWGQLEHRRVPLSLAAEPKAWSRAQALSDGGVLHSHLTAAADGLHLVYASRKGDVFYQRSQDGGRTWSDAVAVSAVDRTHVASDLPHVAVDGRGRVHVVWTQYELPKGWPPLGAFYSRSVDGGRTWSSPRELAGLNRGLISVVTRGEDEVHVAWNAVVAIGDRDHAWSEDGGETWSTPEGISTRVRGGWTGPPAIAFDGAGALHVVTSVDRPEGRFERIVELTRTGSQWSEPQLASGGTYAEKSVEWPTLALSGGNQLHVAYEVDYRQIWYTEAVAEAPPVGPQPVPTVGTDLGSRLADSSLRFRLLLAVVAALIVSAPIELAWRRVRWRTR